MVCILHIIIKYFPDEYSSSEYCSHSEYMAALARKTSQNEGQPSLTVCACAVEADPHVMAAD